MKDCCCGVDVHKSFIIAVIAIFDSEKKEVKFTKYMRFSTFASGLREFKKWLEENNCKHVCMESTGKYYIPVYRAIADGSIQADVVHPKYVKAPKGKKNDKRDAKRIADMYMRDHIAEYSFIPPSDILALRDLTRYRRKTINSISAEKNRLQNCLTVSGIRLDGVLTDVFGKTGSGIIQNIIDTGGCVFDPAPFIQKRVKAKPDEFVEALDGNITPSILKVMELSKNRLEFLGNQKAELESSLESLSKDFSRQINILSSAPGIDFISAVSIIAEIGVDMKGTFGSVKKFLSWCGMVPQNNESAGKKYSTRIGKGNSWLKPVIVQSAVSAIKSKKHPEIREKYETLKKRRGHGKAIVAIAKFLMTAVFFMLLNDEEYSSNLARTQAPNRGTIQLKKLLAYYNSKGITVVTDVGEIVEARPPDTQPTEGESTKSTA